MSEWLRRAGHEVTVLTSKSNGRGIDDEPWVLRTFDMGASGSLRRLLRRSPAPPAQALGYVHKPPPRWFTDVVVPDECLLTWCPAALARARRLAAEREIDCVVSSGPPHSMHVLALLMGRRRPAWVADLRDGWRFEALRPPWPTRGQDRLDATLERRTLQAADAVIGVTGPIADDVRARLGVLSAHVPNGWSPELVSLDRASPELAPPRNCHLPSRLDRERVNLVYTGTLSGPRGRDPRPLFAAMRRFAAERPAAASRLRVVLAGRLDTDEERLLRTLDLGDAVTHVGSLSRAAAIALQRDADALLLLTGPGHTSEATGKLFEYLAAGRPILALARENVAARIVAETGTGVAVTSDDVGAVAQALEETVDGTLAATYKPHGLERYIYPRPAEKAAELIELAIARAQAIRGRRARRRVGDTN